MKHHQRAQDPSVSICAVILARTDTPGLPGQPLMPAGDRCVLDWVLARVLESVTFGPRTLGLPSRNSVVLATTNRHADDALAAWGDANSLHVHRDVEDPDDSAGRLARAARATGATWCVPLRADAPLVDPCRIDASARACTDAADDATGDAIDFAHHTDPTLDPIGSAPPALRVETLAALLPSAAPGENPVDLMRHHLPASAQRRASTLEPDQSAIDLTVATPDDLERFQRFCEAQGDTWLEVPARTIVETTWHAQHPAPRTRADTRAA